jgi:hypothetical protein
MKPSPCVFSPLKLVVGVYTSKDHLNRTSGTHTKAGEASRPRIYIFNHRGPTLPLVHQDVNPSKGSIHDLNIPSLSISLITLRGLER